MAKLLDKYSNEKSITIVFASQNNQVNLFLHMPESIWMSSLPISTTSCLDELFEQTKEGYTCVYISDPDLMVNINVEMAMTD